MKLRSTLLVMHRWAGIVTAFFLLVVAITGCALIFENNIDRALNPDTAYVTPGQHPLPAEALVAAVATEYPGARVQGLRRERDPGFAWQATLSNHMTAFVNPYSGDVLGTRDLQQGFARWIHLLHTRFLVGDKGELFVGWLTVITVLMSLTGIYLWWPRKILGIRRYSSWRRTNFDVHSALGFWASILIFLISFTGVLIAFEKTTDKWVQTLGAAPVVPVAALKSTPRQGATRIPVDDAVRIAETALPGAYVQTLNVPQRPGDIYRVFAKFPEDRTPAGRSHVYIDQFSGKVLAVDNTRTAPLGTKILNLKRSLHTGDEFGAPSLILYFLASFALAGQVVSGVLLWWKPKRKAPAAAKRETTAA